MLRLLTAGESHGAALTAILEGMPANLEVSLKEINKDLARRQQGYGRGARQKIEKDEVQILSGIRHGKTLGSPITFLVENKDYRNWQKLMAVEPVKEKFKPVTQFRPGHADYAGLLKYNQQDIRNVLERASARSTAVQVAVGSLCKQFLKKFQIGVISKIISVEKIQVNGTNLTKAAKARIDRARAEGDSLGGIIEVKVTNPPVGLGSHVQNDRKLDARIGGSLLGLQSVKGVEFGLGFAATGLTGRQVHDELLIKNGVIGHKTNHAGGIEGGISNGEEIIVRIALKPIPTMTNPLPTVDWQLKKAVLAHVERSDICAVEPAAVIAEALVAIEISQALLEKFGGDSLEELLKHFRSA